MLAQSLHGWSGLKRSTASFRVTTLICDFGPGLLAGIHGVSLGQVPNPCLVPKFNNATLMMYLFQQIVVNIWI